MPRQLSEQEYQEIRQSVLDHAPAGMDEASFQRYVGPAMEQAIGIAENTPAPLSGSGVRRALGGLWETLNPVEMVKGLGQAIAHPVQTATNIYAAQKDQFTQGNAARTLPEQLGHYTAGVIPIVGPMAADIGQQAGEGDIAGAMGRTAGLMAPIGAGPVARAGAKAVIGERVAAAADASATSRITDVMAPKVGANKQRFGGMAERVAPQLAREEGLGAMSREGLHSKVAQRLQEAEADLDAAADSRLISQQVQTDGLLAKIDELIASKTAVPLDASRVTPEYRGAPVRGARVTSDPASTEFMAGPDVSPSDLRRSDLGYRSLDEGAFASEPRRVERPLGQAVEPAPNRSEIATLRQIRSELAQLGPTASYESVRRIRDAWDKVAKVRYMPSSAQDVLKAQGDATGAYKATSVLREGLGAIDPQTAAANQRYSMFKSANDVLDATAEAERTRPKVGRGLMRTAAGATAGAISGGGVGAAIGATVGAIVNRAAEAAPTMQIMIARRLAGVADEIRAGNIGRANDILYRLDKQLTGALKTAPAGGVWVSGLDVPTAADSQTAPAADRVQR